MAELVHSHQNGDSDKKGENAEKYLRDHIRVILMHCTDPIIGISARQSIIVQDSLQ
jgi:hypothetical protein